MREWLKKYDIMLRVLSVVIAICLWFVVLSIDNPERTVEKRGIDVSLIGTDELALEYGLGIADSEVPDVSVKLRGTLNALAGVTSDNITVRADVSSIKKSGEYYLPYDISVADGVAIAGRNPDKITVTVEDIVTVDLPVKVEIVGNLSANLETDIPNVSPATVRVKGVKSEIENAEFALVTVEARDITRTFQDSVTYTVVNSAGKELKGSSIRKVDRAVDVIIPVYLSRELELAVDFVEGGGVTASDAAVTIDPPKLAVRGRAEVVAPLSRIVIGTVDLNSFLDNFSMIMPINLPEGVVSLKQIYEANVSVELNDIESTTVTVDDIRLINVPKKYDMVVATDSVIVTLRGDREKLKEIDTEKIFLSVDLADIEPKLGRDVYSATVDLGESVEGVGVYGSYTVIINTSARTGS